MLDIQGLELIIRNALQADYPASPVGLFPREVPLIPHSG